jgi:alkaline phosphatase D
VNLLTCRTARLLSGFFPARSPHLAFVDMSGHGYATVRVSGEEIECEAVCIPRPLERADGGPLR